MPEGFAWVDLPSICDSGVAGVLGNTAAAPARASEVPEREATATGWTGASSIDPHVPHSGQRPTHFATVCEQSEQR
ncbi:hypothetical protein L618_000500000250 [Rhodococcus rhodochrous J45]|uniref:Uncharacterized protein n=1 Tax=Rhodococcus rhodochrous J45 TaxID=935266 RepID=A0A562DJD1_RHORH|nr:hypothetical protein L618_000500000250 [Rhodococcus rhodochrous J45]